MTDFEVYEGTENNGVDDSALFKHQVCACVLGVSVFAVIDVLCSALVWRNRNEAHISIRRPKLVLAIFNAHTIVCCTMVRSLACAPQVTDTVHPDNENRNEHVLVRAVHIL